MLDKLALRNRGIRQKKMLVPAGRALVVAGWALVPAGEALVTSGWAFVPAGRALVPASWALVTPGWALVPAGWASVHGWTWCFQYGPWCPVFISYVHNL